MMPTEQPAAAPRILHLDDGREWRGGQHQVWLLMRELQRMGIEQRLAARGAGPLAERARAIGIPVSDIEFRGEIDWRGPRQTADCALAMQANLLHAHTAHAHAAGLRALGRIGGSARLVTTRRVDFAVGRGWFSGRKYRDPNQHFIAISEGVRRVLIEAGVAAERIDVVHSGVPPLEEDRVWPRERVRRELGIGANEIAVVNTGALTDHKGQRWLIEAVPRVLAACPAARFQILGEGELRGDLEQRIASAGLADRVRLHGYVEEARLKLAGFDLYVSSSHLEGLGTAILDAMLARLPVVAAAAGGVTDVVIDGETGLLVPPRDPAALAAAIIAAIGDPAGSARRAAAAFRQSTERFSAEAMAQGTLDVYRKLLAAGTR